MLRRMLETGLALQVIARIKVLASLQSTERRHPQDGKLSVSFFSRTFDIRVSTFPSVHGEKVVLVFSKESIALLRLSS